MTLLLLARSKLRLVLTKNSRIPATLSDSSTYACGLLKDPVSGVSYHLRLSSKKCIQLMIKILAP